MADVRNHTCNKHVLLFKSPKEGEDPYEKVLRQSGYEVSSIPVLDFTFVNLDKLAKSLMQLENHAAIVFTSQRSVEAVVQALDIAKDEQMCAGEQKQKKCFNLKCYVVGDNTALAAKNVGFLPEGGHCGNAEKLAEFITEDLPSKDKAILYPCGNLRRETLSAKLKSQGYTLEEVEVYKTGKNTHIVEDVKKFTEEWGLPEYVVFFSPSGVQYTTNLVTSGVLPLDQIKVVSIGPTTLQELQSRNIAVHGTAETPHPTGLLNALNL